MPQELKLVFCQKTGSNSNLGLKVFSSSLGLGFWVVFSVLVIFVFSCRFAIALCCCVLLIVVAHHFHCPHDLLIMSMLAMVLCLVL